MRVRFTLDLNGATREVRITVSIGLAPNKLLAKLASELGKPRGFSVIGQAEAKSVLAPMSVRKIHGVGAVTARRSDMWRFYDTLWALHIMDWQNHEDFNHPLIIAVTAITLLSVIAGIVLIPYRIRFGSGRRRKSGPAASAGADG